MANSKDELLKQLNATNEALNQHKQLHVGLVKRVIELRSQCKQREQEAAHLKQDHIDKKGQLHFLRNFLEAANQALNTEKKAYNDAKEVFAAAQALPRARGSQSES